MFETILQSSVLHGLEQATRAIGSQFLTIRTCSSLVLLRQGDSAIGVGS